jgi:DNA-binding protein HU-beta
LSPDSGLVPIGRRFSRVDYRGLAAYRGGPESRAAGTAGSRPGSFGPHEGALMNKGELIDVVAGEAGLSKADATRAVEALLGAVTKALKAGDQVALVGFGTFVAKKRAAREGRNPRTGEMIQIPASIVPGFKAGKALKDAVN